MSPRSVFLMRLFLRCVAIPLTVLMAPSDYYISLNIRHKYTRKRNAEDLKNRLPYLTICQKRRKACRLWSDIDKNRPDITESVRILFSQPSEHPPSRNGARVFLTERGAHVVSLGKYRGEQRRTMLLRSVELGCSHGYVEYQLGENVRYNSPSRLTSKRFADDGSIKTDISPSDEWRLSDPFCIHVMNVIIYCNKWIVSGVNGLRRGKRASFVPPTKS